MLRGALWLCGLAEETAFLGFIYVALVNHRRLSPVTFTLCAFQTAWLFGRANYKEKSAIFSTEYPILHRLPPMVSPGITEPHRINIPKGLF